MVRNAPLIVASLLLTPVAVAAELHPSVDITIGYGGSTSTSTSSSYSAPHVNGGLARLSPALTYGDFVRVGIRASGSFVPRINMHAGTTVLTAGIRIGTWSFIELQGGAGYAWAYDDTLSDNLGVAGSVGGGLYVAQNLALVLVTEFVLGVPGFFSLTSGVQWAPW